MNMKTPPSFAGDGVGPWLDRLRNSDSLPAVWSAGPSILGGFTDQRLEPIISESLPGRPPDSRATVETYLLYRAASSPRARAFDWFETTDRHTDR